MKKKKNSSFPIQIDFSKGTQLSNLITKYNVRIMYAGENRNGSLFTEEVIKQMTSTLGGVPVVGIFDNSKRDFLGHQDLQIVVEGDDVSTNITYPTPYGFVPETPKCWWEKHLDKDGVQRDYLTTEVYMWNGRYPELEKLKEGKNNQSMELNPNTMRGDFAENNDGYYFVPTYAEFHGLCILGEDVEPCFEGASIFSKSKTGKLAEILAEMKFELTEALSQLEEEDNEFEPLLEDEQEGEEPKTEETVVEEDLTVEEDVEEEEEKLEDIEKDIEEDGKNDATEEVEEPVAAIEEPKDFSEEPLEEPLEEGLSIESVEEDAANEIDLQAEIQQLRNLLADRDVEFEALKQNFEEQKTQLEKYIKEELRAEKLEVLNGFLEDVAQEHYQELETNLDSLSKEELVSKAQGYAYLYLKDLKEKVQVPTDFTFEIKDEGSKFAAGSWQEAVLNRQKKQ